VVVCDGGALERHMKVELTDKEKQSRAVCIKGKVDRLRNDWDWYDNMGSQSERTNYIARHIDKLLDELKELTGEEY
jgi:hypothetical protein